MSRLPKSFYLAEAPDLAPALLGKLLCRRCDNGIVCLRITETEAYYTEADTACHAHKGKTQRTQIMYREGGYAYVYLCYGIHSLLNVVCGGLESPQAVLLRGVEGFAGPGRLTKALGIDREFNGEPLFSSQYLWLEDDGAAPTWHTDKRVGIGYAQPCDQDRQWRFILD